MMKSSNTVANRLIMIPMAVLVSLVMAHATASAQLPSGWNGVDWQWAPGISGAPPVVTGPAYPYGYYPAYVYPGSIPSSGYPFPQYGGGYASGYAQGYGDGYNNGLANGYAGGFGNGYAGGFGNAYPGNGYPYPY